MEALKKITLIVISFVSFSFAYAGDCTAIGTGNWSDPTTWSCGVVPGCGDLIVVPFGFTVTVDVNVDLDEAAGCNSATFVLVNGNLQMGNGRKMNFAAGSSVQIMPGGNLFKGVGGGHSNEINITGATSWIAGDGSKPGYFLIGAPFGLPVEFEVFNVEQNATELKLSWVVNSEDNNDFFQVDYSQNGLDWLNIESVKSIGNHSYQYTYELVKERLKVNSELVYFRLSQTDKDGTKRVLAIESAIFENNEITIFPNPAKTTDVIRFNVKSDNQQSSEMVIYNSVGQKLFSEPISLNEGINSIIIDSSQFLKGIYLVKTTESETKRLIIE